MKDGKFKDHKRKDHHPGGAKTFRRGRAIAFLELMNLKRSTLKQQLDSQEFQSIHPIIVGELKAIDMVISEFIQLFELHEGEAVETDSKDTAVEGLKSEEDAELS
ncbi:hypothetical protein [Neobacillus cucumis]|uniref:O-antigen polymerase n=1 Tax=Neobacillus cucumis TaxID=1740721 RepID=A0A2N5H9Q7_9BACI|nr:hypothetical protein [Neobacillus cucumis]PLS02266.1 hypothetical protein CVD27_20580 [Neobacillus cucumis]